MNTRTETKTKTEFTQKDYRVACLLARSFFGLCHHDVATARAALGNYLNKNMTPYFPALSEYLRETAGRELDRLAGLDQVGAQEQRVVRLAF